MCQPALRARQVRNHSLTALGGTRGCPVLSSEESTSRGLSKSRSQRGKRNFQWFLQSGGGGGGGNVTLECGSRFSPFPLRGITRLSVQHFLTMQIFRPSISRGSDSGLGPPLRNTALGSLPPLGKEVRRVGER